MSTYIYPIQLFKLSNRILSWKSGSESTPTTTSLSENPGNGFTSGSNDDLSQSRSPFLSPAFLPRKHPFESLRIRTYNVVSLTPQLGLIEWIRQARSLMEILMGSDGEVSILLYVSNFIYLFFKTDSEVRSWLLVWHGLAMSFISIFENEKKAINYNISSTLFLFYLFFSHSLERSSSTISSKNSTTRSSSLPRTTSSNTKRRSRALPPLVPLSHTRRPSSFPPPLYGKESFRETTL